MTRLHHACVILLGALLLGIVTTEPRFAQTEPPAQKSPGADGQVQTAPRNENEVQQLIEALYISRLQEELKLSDEQYAATIPVVKNYLRVRQAGARQKRLVERQLNQMLDSGAPDDEVQGKLKELDEVKKQNEQNLQSALSEVDSKLDVRQRARFRQYQQRTDQRISHMIQQIREGRRMQRMQGGPPPGAMRATPKKRPTNPESQKR
ncbi:MAG: hypothetical protein LAO21_07230 [Acidobacteriia bacterium]|nr:hypothetical protein [Terriglobia bacterium]